jgi:hypothetical protein
VQRLFAHRNLNVTCFEAEASRALPIQGLDLGSSSLAGCVWQAGLAHFGILFWPTPGWLMFWEILLPWPSWRWGCGNRC